MRFHGRQVKFENPITVENYYRNGQRELISKRALAYTSQCGRKTCLRVYLKIFKLSVRDHYCYYYSTTNALDKIINHNY